MQVYLHKIREEKLFFTEAGVPLMQCVCLIWDPLNTGFTVIYSMSCSKPCLSVTCIAREHVYTVHGMFNTPFK